MRTQRYITDCSLCLSTHISKSVISYILLTGKDLFSWEPGDDIDSGHGSSPSTPGAIEDSDSDIHLFDLEKGLQSDFCDELDSCLFDGEFPTKLYTHIRVKEEPEEDWEKDISSFAFDSLSFSDDCFGEHSKLLEEIFNQPKINNEQLEKPIRKDNTSEESVTEAAGNSTTCPKVSTNTTEEATNPEDTSAECTEKSSFKRQLRKRVRSYIFNEHDYFKSLEETNEVKNDIDDDDKEQKSEDTEDSDGDFEPPRGAAKKSRRTMNSKSDKDDKYWERRKRNNLAAKRSREAKRLREIETTKKTQALEKENANLKNQVRKLKAAIKRAEKRLRVMI